MKEIPLTKGYVAIVDDVDYARVSQLKWHALVRLRSDGTIRDIYAQAWKRTDHGRQALLLHRFVAEVTDPLIHVDHWDNNALNCRRRNLRSATNQQNQANGRKKCVNTSGFKGVTWDKERGQYKVQIEINGHSKHLGRVDSAVIGAHLYDAAAIDAFGEFAHLNFPRSSI